MAASQGPSYQDAPVDELVGKMMFRAYVTAALARSNRSFQLLESEIVQFIRSYDYRAAIQNLEAARIAFFPIQEPDLSRAVFQVLGSAYRFRPQSQAYALIYSLLQLSHLGGNIEPHVNTLASSTLETPQSPPLWRSPSNQVNMQSNSHRAEDLSRYTAALFQKGQEDGKTVERTYSTISGDFLQFKANIRFDDLEGSGVGRTKKIAAHLAARDLCSRMGLSF